MWCDAERRARRPSAALALAVLVAAFLLPALPPVVAHATEVTRGTEHHLVIAQDGTFSPNPLDIRLGDHVEFLNADSNVRHRIIADDGRFDSGYIWPGKKWEWISNMQGNLTYHSEFDNHSMRGTLRIGPPPPPNQAPNVTILTPSEGSKVQGVVDITGTAEEPDMDWLTLWIRINGGTWRQFDAAGSWRVPWDTKQVANGHHVIEVEARDRWGERSEPATRIVEVANPTNEPRGLPTVAITRPLPNARLTGEIVIEGIGGRPSATSPLEIKVRIDEGAWKIATGGEHWSLTWDTRTTKDGVHRIEAVATDGVRTGPPSRVNVLVANAGTAQTTVQILSPGERQLVNGTIDIRGLADDPDTTDIVVFARVDGGDWKRASGARTWSWRWNTSNVANGPHVIEVYAQTEARKSALAKVTLITDNGARLERPTVEFISPEENARLSGVVLFRGRANSTTTGPLTVQVRVDDGPWESVSGSVKWAWTLNTTRIPNGVHHVKARAFTDVGYSTTIDRSILVFNAPSAFQPEGDFEEEDLVTAVAPLKRKPAPAEDEKLIPAPPLAAMLALAAAAAVAFSARASRPRRP